MVSNWCFLTTIATVSVISDVAPRDFGELVHQFEGIYMTTHLEWLLSWGPSPKNEVLNYTEAKAGEVNR